MLVSYPTPKRCRLFPIRADAALLGKLPYQLEECDGQYGLCTMCIGFGQGVTTIVERI